LQFNRIFIFLLLFLKIAISKPFELERWNF
jgi:hypothetical protein